MKSIAIAAATAFVCTLSTHDLSAATVPTLNVNNVNDPVNHCYQESSFSSCGISSCPAGSAAA